MCSI